VDVRKILLIGTLDGCREETKARRTSRHFHNPEGRQQGFVVS
jgi:hypothetical protein